MISDLKTNEKISYTTLLESVNSTGVISNIVVYDGFISFYISLIRAMAHFDEVYVLDSHNEAESNIVELRESNVGFKFQDFSFLLESSGIINLKTSGTTGLPRFIKQKNSNLLRLITRGRKFPSSHWMFCYNPSHIAGLQVFFQALIGESSLTYVFETEPSQVALFLKHSDITNISFTPTFFKLLSSYLNGAYPSVKTVSFGGERLPESTLELAKLFFPNARMKNLYASTEFGTILNSEGHGFEIIPSLKEKVKIENNELYVHKDLLGKLDIEDEWYPTGDIVEFISDSKFVFVSRKSEVFNVGGYNVSPGEIESVLAKISLVQSARVFGRKNSMLGNIVCAEIVLSFEAKELSLQEIKKSIIAHCSELLVEWKIPRMISFVDKIELTKSGKVKANG